MIRAGAKKIPTALGFTLVEILIAVSLLAFLLVGVIVNGASGAANADASAFSRLLTSALNTAREQAITTGQPVAIVFPSDGGSKPHSQAYYKVTGKNPRTVDVVSFQSEHPRACAMNGMIFDDAKVELPKLASSSELFNLVTWIGSTGLEEDFVFCFLPNGNLITNDLPVTEGEFHILVSSGLNFTTANPPGSGWNLAPSYYRPTEVSSPRLISLSPTGQIREGPFSGAPGVSRVASLDFIAPPATPPKLSMAGSSAPTINTIEVFPKPDPATTPPDVEAYVDVDGYLNLKILAADSDPERALFCTWTSDRGGPFTKPDAHQMEWDQNASGPGVGGWVSRVEWRPPPGTKGGDEFILSTVVADETGANVGDEIGVTGKVVAVDDELIVFNSARSGVLTSYSMLSDGSDVTLISEIGDRDAVISPAGDKVMFARANTLYVKPFGGEEFPIATQPGVPTYGPYPTAGLIKPACFNRRGNRVFWTRGTSAYTASLNGDQQVSPYLLNADPGFRDSFGDREVDPALSPDGTKLAFDDGGNLYVADFVESPGPGNPHLPDGPVPTTDVEPGRAAGNPKWSQADGKLSYHASFDGNLEAVVAEFDPSSNSVFNKRILAGSAAQEGPPAFSPDGSEVVFSSQRTGNFEIFRANADGSGLVNLTNDPAADYRPSWSF